MKAIFSIEKVRNVVVFTIKSILNKCFLLQSKGENVFYLSILCYFLCCTSGSDLALHLLIVVQIAA